MNAPLKLKKRGGMRKNGFDVREDKSLVADRFFACVGVCVCLNNMWQNKAQETTKVATTSAILLALA